MRWMCCWWAVSCRVGGACVLVTLSWGHELWNVTKTYGSSTNESCCRRTLEAQIPPNDKKAFTVGFEIPIAFVTK